MSENYTNYIYICEDCGSCCWEEINEKGISVELDLDGNTKKTEENWKESDVNYQCSDCRGWHLEYIEIVDMPDEQLKAIAKMNGRERMDWLKKYQTLKKLK